MKKKTNTSNYILLPVCIYVELGKILYIFILSTNVTNNCIIKGLLSIAQCSAY